jgi:hypothetical protein
MQLLQLNSQQVGFWNRKGIFTESNMAITNYNNSFYEIISYMIGFLKQALSERLTTDQ